jgi:hypothetical protein
MCNLGGICLPNVAYALADVETKQVYRLSFSRSLLNYIRNSYPQYGHLRLVRVKFEIGEKLEPGQSSSTGVYAICKRKNGWPLRLTALPGIAEAFRDESSRTIHECTIQKIIKAN